MPSCTSEQQPPPPSCRSCSTTPSSITTGRRCGTEHRGHVQEPTGDQRVIPTFRRFAQLRDKLVPYLVDQAHITIAEGRPLMRALFLDHADDPEIWQHPLQYHLGDQLLVKPVTEPDQTEWTTYLPAGNWIDAWTSETAPGAQVHTSGVPIDAIPVYCSAAAWPKLKTVFAPIP